MTIIPKKITLITLSLIGLLLVGCYSSNSPTADTPTSTAYTVNFELNGGTGTVAKQTITPNQTATQPTTAPSKSGYIFKGWYNITDDIFSFDTEITGNTTLYAKWLTIVGGSTLINGMQSKILNTMRFLPDDPKEMTDADKEFYLDTNSWKLSIASFKGLNDNSKTAIRKTLNMVRYMVLTKRFAKYTMEIESKYHRVVDSNKYTYHYRDKIIEEDYRVSGVELLLLVRGMTHAVVFKKGTFDSSCNCFKGDAGIRKSVNLNSLSDEELKKGVDVVSKFGFVLGKSVLFPSDTNYKASGDFPVGIYGLLIHEILHNYGYLHPSSAKNKVIKEELLALNDWRPGDRDVPYYIHVVLDQMGGRAWGLYGDITNEKKGNMPETDDIKQYNASFRKYWSYAKDGTIPDYYKYNSS